MSRIIIRQADAGDKEAWDRYVEAHSDSWPYHLYAWKQSVEESYGFRGQYLVAENKNRIVGVFPQILMTIPFLTKNIVALPYCDVGGLQADSEDVSQALISDAVVSARKQQVKFIDLRGNIDSSVLKTLQCEVQSKLDKVRMILPLPETSDLLWDSFKSKLRSQVRKAQKNGLTFEFSKNINDFYTVFSENMRDLGSPVHSKKWIESVVDNYGDKARIGLVCKDQRPVGAGIILSVGQKVSMPWASTLRQYNRLGPNMLLYWNFLKFAADNGFYSFDFGRSTPDEGTYRFKSQWGAKPVVLAWHRIYLDDALPAEKETLKNRERIAHIWQKLPLGFANLIGPILRKYISL